MQFKDIEVGDPELRLLFKLLMIDQIVVIKNFTNEMQTYTYRQLENLGELELTVSEYCYLHNCRIYVK